MNCRGSGIYKITNLINGKIYIGSSVDLYSRYRNHFYNYEHNIYLKRAFIKHGRENFKFEVLEYCEKEKLIKREQHYLDTMLFAQEYIQSGKKDKRFRVLSYNVAPLAGSRLGLTITKEHKLIISTPIIQFTIEGEYVKRFDSIREAAKEVNRTTHGIGSCCRGMQEFCAGYRWCYERDYLNGGFIWMKLS